MKNPYLILGLCCLVALFVAGDALFAWTAPSAVPPSGNVVAPLNTGTAEQDKNGVLGVNGLSAFGRINVVTGAPTMSYEDTTAGEGDWWTRVNVNRFSFIFDRNDDDDLTNDNRLPLLLQSGATPSEDYALFSNQIRAVEYCDRTGGNCFSPSTSLGQGGVAFEADGQNTVRDLKPGTTYLFFVTGPAADWSGASISTCGAPSTIVAQTRFDTITGRTTQESHLIPYRVPAGVTCIRGYTSGTRRYDAEYIIAVEAMGTMPTPTYSWDVGPWPAVCSTDYLCSGATGSQTRSVSCVNNLTDAVVADSRCTGTKPASTQSCTGRTTGGQCR